MRCRARSEATSTLSASPISDTSRSAFLSRWPIQPGRATANTPGRVGDARATPTGEVRIRLSSYLAAGAAQRRLLQGKELFDPLLGQVQQRVQLGPGEDGTFGRALHFDEAA